jgi:hypothetical protein
MAGRPCGGCSAIHRHRNVPAKTGIYCGNFEGSCSQGWSELDKALHSCAGVSNILDKRRNILDLEEKELADEEEVDRLLLQNICGEIMEEVMDVGGDDFLIPTNHSSKLRAHKKGGKVVVWKTNK